MFASRRPQQQVRSRAGRFLVLAGWLAVLIGGLAAASPVLAQDAEDEPRGWHGWTGTFEAGPHIVVQRSRGSVETNFDYAARKANIITSLNFRLGAGIRGPEVELPGVRFSPVLYGAVLLPLNESSTIGAQLLEDTTPLAEIAKESRFAIEYQTSGLLGLGAEFRIPVFDSEIKVRPAVESLHLVTRYTGLAQTAFDPSTPNAETIFNGAIGKREITQHFIGPALRVSSPTFHVRAVTIDFHLGASVVFDVAGTRRKFTVVEENGDRGTFNFESGSGALQASLGIRVLIP